MGDHLETLRRDVLAKRLKGPVGGNQIVWSAPDAGRITDHVMSLPARDILRAAPTGSRKLVDAGAAARRKLSERGIVIRAAPAPEDLNFLFIISFEDVDLVGDVVTVAGVDCTNFAKNPAVLNGHNSSALPIAASTSPAVSGQALTAIARFPQPGVSEPSDQVAAAIRGGLVRAASIGFVPLRWSFSKDPSRPFGVDFQEVRLLEWSVCSIPANPGCLLLGAVQGGKSASRASRNVPVDDVPDEDWQCCGDGTLPINSTDDAFDPTAAKAALLAKCSPGGTILDAARRYFFAVDVSAPFEASSYAFPFCRVGEAGIVASKIGWRQSFAALEKSSMPGMLVSEARSLVDSLEVRLGDVKTAVRRREARALAALAKSISAEDAPMTRDQRLAEARNFRPPLTRDQRIAEARNLRRAVMERGKVTS